MLEVLDKISEAAVSVLGVDLSATPQEVHAAYLHQMGILASGHAELDDDHLCARHRRLVADAYETLRRRSSVENRSQLSG
jgi:hypothetical protein